MLTLVAFTLQNFLTQTHIHFTPAIERALASTDLSKSVSTGARRDDRDKYPANGNPANCPICQEMLYAGNYVTPSAAAAPPTLTASLSVPAGLRHIRPPSASASHSWQGRGPPLV